jgi:periplasmic divalent cation tolerance protein
VTDPAVELCEVVITAPDPDWLVDFTRQLVNDHLAASAHTLDQVRTVYRWEGEVHQATEARAMIRTRLALVPTIVERVKRDHPYLVPGVVAVPLVAASPDYAAWIHAQTQHAPDPFGEQ